jgi:hypothetical protein
MTGDDFDYSVQFSGIGELKLSGKDRAHLEVIA